MSFAEDLSVFISTDTPGAVIALIGATEVTGLFDNGFADMGGMIGGSHPTLLCISAEVAMVVNGTALTIGGQSYTVAGTPQPDGTGLALLQLREA